jgi:hypothetical protein
VTDDEFKGLGNGKESHRDGCGPASRPEVQFDC